MEIVKTGTLEVTYEIRKHDEGVYDWSNSRGDESDEWFETAEEAEADIRSRF